MSWNIFIYGSNVLGALAYFYRTFDQSSDFLDITHLLTHKLVKQNYVAPRWQSSLQAFLWSSSHTRYITIDIFLFTDILFFPPLQTRISHRFTLCVSYNKKQQLINLREHHHLVLRGVRIAHICSFCFVSVVFVFFLCLYPMLSVSLDYPL